MAKSIFGVTLFFNQLSSREPPKIKICLRQNFSLEILRPIEPEFSTRGYQMLVIW